ncbi:unnamed protein product [Adineta ricciae]|uniref:F-box domain-containing protein n=1 Tax=Adineta ricciae TaxID=249248 RepID=A0A814VEQ9_ADIRI|nr:unnamed protein product [Adineta ricciae]
MENISLLSLPPEICHRIFDYCDSQTILLSVRGVCRYLHDITSTYSRFELKCNLSKNSKYDVLFRFISPASITSLTIDNKYHSHDDDVISCLTRNFPLIQFTQLRSLHVDGCNYSVIKIILSSIPFHSLDELSITQIEEHTRPQVISLAAKFNLRKFVFAKSELTTNDNILWPINWQLECLEIGTCNLLQYLSICKRIPSLRTLVIEDCVVGEYWPKISNGLSNQLKSLTITNCSAYFEELELLFSAVPALTHLELVFDEDMYEYGLNGHRLERILKRRLPLLHDFKFFFAYHYSENSNIQILDIKSLILPFRSSFWLEEKHWYITCDHILQTRMIRIYTTPVQIRYDKGRFSEQELREHRCEVSSKDYTCRFIRRSFEAQITEKNLTMSYPENIRTNNEIIQDLAAALEHDDTFLTLDLSKNHIGDTEVEQFVNALRSNTTLNTIDLSNNAITDVGAQHLAEYLKYNTKLTAIDLSNNAITDVGAEILALCLTHNTSLRTLNLTDNNSQFRKIIEATLTMRTNATLTTLDMSSCDIGDIGAVILAEVLRSNTIQSTNYRRCFTRQSNTYVIEHLNHQHFVENLQYIPVANYVAVHNLSICESHIDTYSTDYQWQSICQRIDSAVMVYNISSILVAIELTFTGYEIWLLF